MRRVLIANPGASRVTEARLAAVERALSPVEVWRTERSGHAVELAREAGAATVFVLGGDGTFNEVLNGCAAGATLGFLPSGGTNVLTRALGLPRDPVEVARALEQGVSHRSGTEAERSRRGPGGAADPGPAARPLRAGAGDPRPRGGRVRARRQRG